MSENCGTVTKPVVDNTAEECGGVYVSEGCIVCEKTYEYLGSKSGKTLDLVIADLVEIINKQRTIISGLKRDFKRLNVRLKKL